MVISQVTGSSGLGFGTIELDWPAYSIVQPLVTSLVTSWFAQVNMIIGFVHVVWEYYSNLWSSENYPILSAHLLQENGSDLHLVLTDNVLDQKKYFDYGPKRMDSFFALIYKVLFVHLVPEMTYLQL